MRRLLDAGIDADVRLSGADDRAVERISRACELPEPRVNVAGQVLDGARGWRVRRGRRAPRHTRAGGVKVTREATQPCRVLVQRLFDDGELGHDAIIGPAAAPRKLTQVSIRSYLSMHRRSHM
jgi:hypothetical protein